MAALSDYLENKVLDWLLRAQTFTPPATVYAALLTAAPSDSGGGTEVSGGSYARVAVTSSLANWAGTQSAGSTTASSGTGGTTSNNNVITFPAPTASWGVCTHFGFYDASSGGNLLWYGTLASSKTVNNGDAAPTIAAGAATLTIDGAGALSDYLENKLIDWLLRGQTFTQLTNVYPGLLTAAPSDSGGGTEVSGGSYARVTVACSLANWAGTQSAGSTTASSGTGGTTSNNNAITFPAPSASWGTVTHTGVYDASSAGNLLFWGALTTSKAIGATDPAPSFAAAALSFQLDN